MTDSILQLDGVVKDFNKFRAVGGKDGLTFDVKRGGFLGLIGPNGAGKSTTFNLISGVLRPSMGKVTFDGVDLSPLNIAEIAALGLGRTFQTPRAFESLNVIDNVMVGLAHAEESPMAALFGRWKPAERALTGKAEAALERVGLIGRRHDAVSNLSGGELRMLEVARQLVRDPRILLNGPKITIREGVPGRIGILFIRFATRKDEGASCKIDLVMSFYHQDLWRLFTITNDQDGGRKAGFCRGLRH